MASNVVQSSGGIDVCDLLGVVFVTLKLFGVIAWPWIWVLAPFWIGFALFVSIALMVLAFVAVVGIVGLLMNRR